MRTLYALAAALVLALAAPAEAQSYMAGNPCLNSLAPLKSITGATSGGTTATQVIALSATQTIYVCSLTVMAVSGTTPTFSLVYGTGSNCGTGQGTLIPAFTTNAGQLYGFYAPVAVLPSANALCYLDTGTTPIQSYTITYVQL